MLVVFLATAAVRLPGLLSRAIWYDEAVTLLETAGHASPSWPSTPVLAGVAKKNLAGSPSLSKIAEDLRRTDIYPPVYYWSLSLWRRWCGFSLEAARAFSLLCSLGTVFVFYLLLRFGNLEYPLVPTVVYAMSTESVYLGQETRVYALATFLVTTSALLAYLAWRATQHSTRSVIGYSIAMAVCCGAAFQTYYLALFPVGVILSWFFVNLWPVSRLIAVAPPLVSVSLAGLGFSALLQQLGARPSQLVGFVGIAAESKMLFSLNLQNIWTPYLIPINQDLAQGVYMSLTVLVGLTLVHLLRHWQEINRGLWILLLGLASAPSLGVTILDFVFDKHLHNLRYLALAEPALTAIVTYGITRVLTSRQRLGISLLVIFLGLQMLTINWGHPQGFRVHPGLDMRSLAELIHTSSSPAHVVVIGEGDRNESGHPGSVIYELAPETTIIVLNAESDLQQLQANIQDYEDVWLVFSVDQGTTDVEYRFLDGLQKSDRYQEVFRSWPTIHLRRGEKADESASP
jgi:hypothetical protein